MATFSLSATVCALARASVWPYMHATAGELTAGYPWFDVPGENMTAPAYNLVFRPNDTSGASNVYLDWPTLYAARLAIQGAVQIELDGSGGALHVPSGNYDFTGMTFISFQSQPQGYTLIFDDGAKISNFSFAIMNGCNFRNSSTSAVATVSSLVFFTAIGSEIYCDNSNAPFFHVVSGGVLSATCSSETVFGSTSQSPHRNVIKVDTGGTCACVGLTGTEWTDGVLDPTSTGSIQLYFDASSLIGSNPASGLVTNLLDEANLVAYAAASAANWNNNAPTNVKAALDRIAAKIGPIS